MLCKACNRGFHNCPSCDNEEHQDNGYCSADCYRTIKPDYEAFYEAINRLNPKVARPVKVTRITKEKPK